VKYRNEVRMLPVRRYPQYLVFYAISSDNEVVILNVRHAARRHLPKAED
jgi:plasmid stabilization system protein ParE